MMIKELDHVAIRTEDMKAALHFYVEILGGKIIRDAAMPDGSRRHVFVQIANGVMELLDGEQKGLVHVAFRTGGNYPVREICDALRAKGLEILGEPKQSLVGNGNIASFRDFSGVTFELCEREENFRVSNLENKHILEFEHIYIRLYDDNAARCAAFYTDTMGFRLRAEFLKEGSRTIYYSNGPHTIETGHKAGETRGDRLLLEHICFRVKDVGEMKAYLESNGAECPEPKESSTGGFRVMKITGPAGEIVEFVDREVMERYQSPYRVDK